MRATDLRWLGLLLVAACNGGGDGGGTGATDGPSGATGGYAAPCAYPEGAAAVMTPGEVLPTFSWPDARHLDGRTASLELESAACDVDDDIDWSLFDVLLFISIPAW